MEYEQKIPGNSYSDILYDRSRAYVKAADQEQYHCERTFKQRVGDRLHEAFPRIKTFASMQENAAQKLLTQEIEKMLDYEADWRRGGRNYPLNYTADLAKECCKIAREQLDPLLAFGVLDFARMIYRGTQLLNKGLNVLSKAFTRTAVLYAHDIKEFVKNPASSFYKEVTGTFQLASDLLSGLITVAFGSHDEREALYAKLNTIKDHLWENPHEAVSLVFHMLLPSPSMLVAGKIVDIGSRISRVVQEEEKIEKMLASANKLSKEAQVVATPTKNAVNQALLRVLNEFKEVKEKVKARFGDMFVLKDKEHHLRLQVVEGKRGKELVGLHTERLEKAHIVLGTYVPPDKHGVYKGNLIHPDFPEAAPNPSSFFLFI